MRDPLSADDDLVVSEKQLAFARCVADLNKSHIGEVRLQRMNRLANLRRHLLELIQEMIETRAEDLAAGILQQFAEERQAAAPTRESAAAPFALPRSERKRSLPKWVREESQALRGRASMRTKSTS